MTTTSIESSLPSPVSCGYSQTSTSSSKVNTPFNNQLSSTVTSVSTSTSVSTAISVFTAISVSTATSVSTSIYTPVSAVLSTGVSTPICSVIVSNDSATDSSATFGTPKSSIISSESANLAVLPSIDKAVLSPSVGNLVTDVHSAAPVIPTTLHPITMFVRNRQV